MKSSDRQMLRAYVNRPLFLRLSPSVRLGMWLKRNFGWLTVSIGLMWIWWRDL